MYTTPNTSFHPQPTALSRESSLPPDSAPQTQQKLTPGKDRRKLRESCDACAAAKVRCSKNRPRCERCTECDSTCVYGPSMKHGKSAGKRKHPQPQPMTENSQPKSKPSEHDLQRSFSDLLQSIFSTANLSLPPSRPFNNEVPITGTTLPSAPSTTNSPSFDDLIWTDGMAYGDTGSTATATATSTSKCSTNAHLDPFGDTLALISSANFPQLINSEPLDAVSSPSSTSPAGPNTNRHFPLQSNFLDSSGAHNCYVMANSTLAILDVLPRPLNDSNSSETTSPLCSTSSGCASTQAAQSLDDVLSCTRDAMGNMQRLLKCPCARDPHMAMLEASIIMRILFWHQLVAGIRTSSYLPQPTPDGGPAFMDTFASSMSTPASWSSRGSSTPTTFIASEPVRLGNYIPDQEDQEHMQRLFLLINLQKVKQLIDAFAQVAELVDVGPSHLHTTLASWLNSELSQAVKEVGSGAKAAVGQLA